MLSVQIAVHGCGSRGRTYARIATSFDDRYRITAATDPVAQSRESVAIFKTDS